MVEQSIQSVIDLDRVNEEVRKQNDEQLILEAIKDDHEIWIDDKIDEMELRS